jgi:hypothetical protein
LVLLSQKNLQKIMAQQSLSVQGVFKNQREREKERKRAAGEINGKAFAPEIDITSNSSVRSFFCSSI